MAASQKSSKKRPAQSQAGPRPKKVHIDKSAKPRTTAEKKRSRPVTAVISDEIPSESDLGEGKALSAEEDEWVGVDDTEDIEKEGDELEVETNTVNLPPKDPNAARESHQAQRVLHDQRRAQKPHSSLLSDAKRVWSLARQKNIATPERQKLIRELMNVIRGKVKDIVFKHDASRIVQTVVKYGSQKERDEVATELRGNFKGLAQNKYSKFLVTKLIRLCPSHRASILLEFQSHVLRLLLHREASSVLADAFELYANAYERSIILRDFYGKETSLFSSIASNDEEKEKAKKGLSGVLDGIDGDRRKRVLAAVKENLVTIFNNPDKGAVTHAVVHRTLWEYLRVINDVDNEVEREKLRREMFESCQDVLAEMVHTKDGSRVVRDFIAQSTAKDRKHIVKVLKPHVERMCTDDEAQLVLFTAIDTIDDTKLTTKSLVTPITSVASSLCASPQGRRALFHLLVPRTRRHFTPAQIASLAETDAARAITSKKDDAVRRDEVRKAASEALLAFVQEKGVEVSRETGGSLVVAEIMLTADGDKSPAGESLLYALTEPYPAEDSTQQHPIDLPHTSRMYKTLLQGGHFSLSAKKVERADRFDAGSFAAAFVRVVGKERTVQIAKREGTFVVAELCERLREEGMKKEMKEVREWFGDSDLHDIETGDSNGKTVLLEKIRALE